MTELIRRLDRNRYAVHVACFDNRGARLSRINDVAASVTSFPIEGFGRPGTVRQLLCFARWCRQHRIAVIQTCDLYANIFGLIGAAMAGVPVRVGSRRELNPDKSPRQIRLQRLAYRFATHIVANSPAAVKILETEGVGPEHVALIPNGVDVASFSVREPRGSIRETITVANLRAEKSHETLIAAAAALAPSHPSLRFTIVGAGSRRDELEALTRARSVEHIVEFVGHRDDVPGLLAAADLFVLPSRSEAFPNSAIEAMAAGLPVIASSVGGLLDLIEDGRTGLLVPPCNPEALADAIASLVADPARAHRLGFNARAEVVNRYSFDRMTHSFAELYETGLRERHALHADTATAGA